MTWVVWAVVIIGWLYGGACLRLGRSQGVAHSNKNASFGHHYQRDTVFHDIMGL